MDESQELLWRSVKRDRESSDMGLLSLRSNVGGQEFGSRATAPSMIEGDPANEGGVVPRTRIVCKDLGEATASPATQKEIIQRPGYATARGPSPSPHTS